MRGLLMGYEQVDPGLGFHRQETGTAGAPIRYEGEAPITVIAPTGSGKGRDFLIPLLLEHTGPAIVIDMKGELSAVCARRRRELGHQVAIVDPFGVTGKPSDRIDPFELFELPGSLLECDAEMLATMLNDGHVSNDDPFWDDAGSSLIAGLIALAAYLKEPGLAFLRKYLFSDDSPYAIAVLLDSEGKRCPYAYGELAAFLQHADQQTRPCVLATARTFLRALNSPQVAACLENPTVRLKGVQDGEPIDIFTVIPPEKANSHSGLSRMLIGTMLTAIMRRSEMPEEPTLLIIDEAAQLGKEFAPLLTASTLMRGYGLRLITAWQDLAQIKSRYKTDWQTILNNSGALLTFGSGHYAAAKDTSEFLGLEPRDLLRLKPDEAMLAMRGEGVRTIRRANYLRDERFAGLFDSNPYYKRRENPGRGG